MEDLFTALSGEKEIYEKLHLRENPEMPRMKKFTDTEFELTYFND